MKKILLLLSTLLFYPVVHAEPNNHYNRIHLSSAAEQQAINDLMTMTLIVRKNGQESADIAQYINQTMQWAVNNVKKYEDIVVRTENYQINPIYDYRQSKKKQFIEWRGQQSLILKSSDIEAMSTVTALLLKKMQMQSQKYSLSFTKKEQLENTLIKQALTVLKNRAVIVQNSFSAKNYRLVNVNINTQSSGPVYRNNYRSKMMMADSAMEGAPVASESGQSKVKVTVSGQIELIM